MKETIEKIIKIGAYVAAIILVGTLIYFAMDGQSIFLGTYE